MPSKILFIANCENDIIALHSMGYSAILIPSTINLHKFNFSFLSESQLIIIINASTNLKRQYIEQLWVALQTHAKPKVVWLDLPLTTESDGCLTDWIREHLGTAGVMEWKTCPIVPHNHIWQIKRMLSLELEYAKTIEDVIAEKNIGGKDHDSN